MSDMKLPVYSIEGIPVSEIELSDVLFSVAPNYTLLAEVMDGYRANSRQIVAHTKTRGEVSGGGRKPWKQKGTGRARHGSIRSPLWVGGGITFGPRSTKVFKKKINKKIAHKALTMVLSDRVSDNKFFVVEHFNFGENKTKQGVSFLEKVCGDTHTLVVLPHDTKDIVRVFRNIAKAGTVRAADLNAYEVLRFNKVVFSVDSVGEVASRLSK